MAESQLDPKTVRGNMRDTIQAILVEEIEKQIARQLAKHGGTQDERTEHCDDAGVVDALAAWVSSTLAGHTYPAPDGTYKEVRVFTHNLPEPEGDDDADLAFCPFCIVHAGSGTVEDWGRQTMPIVLLFCVYDTGTSRQGYRDLLSIKEKVMAAALKNSRVDPCEILLPIDWNTDDGQYREFRYGTVDFMVEAPTITAKESDLT